MSKRRRQTISKIVKELLDERLTIEAHETPSQDWSIPDWVPDGKFVALVKGAVVAVGDSVAEVTAQAASKFRDEYVQVKRKGQPIPVVEYAYHTLTELKCWRYYSVGPRTYPVIPVTIIGKRKVETTAMPDSAASLTLVKEEVVEKSGLKFLREEDLFTGAGPVTKRTFEGKVELPMGTHKVRMASVIIPDGLPFKVLLGRNILDSLQTYLLGKDKVLCIKDPPQTSNSTKSRGVHA